MPRSAGSGCSFQPIVTLGDTTEPVDADRLARALGEANVPTLVAVLAHLTGEERWFQPPYPPTRTKGLSDHAEGDLTEAAQAEVRAAALTATLRWAADPDHAVRQLDDAELVRIMNLCMGEPVAPKYVGMMAEEMGLRPRYDNDRIARLRPTDRHSAIIVGAGASGICMAVQLKQAGIPFTILEKNPTVGGTWYENRYPDCGVDTPSYWYSFSFNPVNWAHYYSKRDDVQGYLDATVDRFGLREHIRFGTRVDTATYDQASCTWHVDATGPDGAVELDARFLVSAVGQLNQPKVPAIPGQEDFAHEQFHSARWPTGYSVRGKRVAVVGTGASAMQLVPAVADEVSELTIFQRSPQWVAPNPEYTREVSADTRYLMEHVPFYAAWYRMRQAWVFGDKVYDNLVVDPQWPCTDSAINSINDGYRRYFTSYIRAELEGRPDLLEKALPDYPPFGKRMLLDSGWYRTLRLPHVSLETSQIESISENAIHTKDGDCREVDTIVYATGFDSLRLLGSFDVRGRDGRTLREQWGDDDARAYLGMTERGFPNLFFLYGPNTNLGHGGSLLFITECHVRYIMGLIGDLIERDGSSLECREDLRDLHNAEIDAAHAGLVWSHPGMQTWYRNDRGRVVTNSPWRLIDLWEMTGSPRLDDYELTVQ